MMSYGWRYGVATTAVAALAIGWLMLWAPRANAATDPLLPPRGKIFSGVAMGTELADFTRRTKRRPDVWEHFVQIGGTYDWAIDRARGADTRLLLHLSTAPGQNAGGRLSPGEI